MYDLQIEFPEPAGAPRPVVRDRRAHRRPTGDVLTAPTERRPRRPRRRAATPRRSRRSASASSTPTPTRPTSGPSPSTCAASSACPVCISAEVSPQIREYPRMITTACNAATMPVIGPYLDELQKWLAAEGFGGSVLMMLSNGGVVSADDAARAPIRLVESGPAAGALAGSWFARRLGEDRLLCFDMGGTTAKSCLIEDGEPELTNTFEVARIYRFKKGSGFPVSVPSVDLVEIGAGGGSLARVDELGLLKVGPESSGADPGPASYGRGGTRPAVTDADLLLGLLDPDYFLGGDMPLDVGRPTKAVEPLADRARPARRTTPPRACTSVVNQNMAAAVPHARRRAGGRPARRGAPRLRRRRARARVRRRRAARLRPGRSSRSTPACCRPSARSSRRCASTSPARSSGASTASTSRSATPCSTSCGPRARRVLAAAGVPEEAVRFRYGARRPLRSARATRSPSGWARARRGRRRRRCRGRALRRASTSASTA